MNCINNVITSFDIVNNNLVLLNVGSNSHIIRG